MLGRRVGAIHPRAALARPQSMTPTRMLVRLPYDTRAGTCRLSRLETGAERGTHVRTAVVGLRRARAHVAQP